jgi:Tol biopolymer transport system component
MDGGAMKRFDTMPPTATWSPDGRSLVFFNTAGGVSNLMRQPLSGGAATPITQFASEQIFTYALSPDQKQLAVVRGRVSADVVLISTVEKQQ